MTDLLPCQKLHYLHCLHGGAADGDEVPSEHWYKSLTVNGETYVRAGEPEPMPKTGWLALLCDDWYSEPVWVKAPMKWRKTRRRAMSDLTREQIERLREERDQLIRENTKRNREVLDLILRQTNTTIEDAALANGGPFDVLRRLIIERDQLRLQVAAAEHFVPGIEYALENCRPDEIAAARVFWGKGEA